MRRVSLTAVVPLLFWTGVALAEEAAPHAAEPGEHAASAEPGEHAEGGEEHAHGEHHHAHHVAVFGGVTHTEEGGTHPSVGLDYFFYLPVMDRRIGVGPLFDATFAEEAELLFGLAVAAKGPAGLQLAMAPIYIKAGEAHAWGGRVNLAYDFHFAEMWSVGPTVSADFLPHEVAFVGGLNVGVGL